MPVFMSTCKAKHVCVNNLNVHNNIFIILPAFWV